MEKIARFLCLGLVLWLPAGRDSFQHGTVKYIGLEGGFYAIVTDRGERYDPTHLDPAFQQEGMKVRFRAQPQKNGMTIHMWGQPVQILQIERES